MNFSLYTTKTAEEIFDEFKVTQKGLENGEVAHRLNEYGRNEIEAKEIRWWQIFLRQIKSPFIYILFVAALISSFLGELTEAIMILIFVVINATLSFLQEYHSEKNLKLLKKYIVSRAKVRRANEELTIESQNLVPGDFVIVEAGDKIPADLRFLEENNLMVDEEILTGESAPVHKTAAAQAQPAKEFYQAENIGFSGTVVVAGRGAGVVLATGKNTGLGGIAKLTAETKRVSSFEKGILGFSKFILRLILITIVLVFLANILVRGEKANIVELIIFSIALAISVIPEPLPAVTTISLSRGALQLAKSKVIVKRLSAIEDLGSVEVLCTDKTGTLTENKLAVEKIKATNEEDCLFSAAIASSFLSGKEKKPTDAFDIALCEKLSPAAREKINQHKRLAEIPFSPARRRNSVLVQTDGETELIVRGAPEIIFELCPKLKEPEKNSLKIWMAAEGALGHRILAIAKKKISAQDNYDLEKEENNLQFLGIISFVDPIKKTASHTIAQAKNLGIKIKILTGDSPEVAGAVAYKIDLINSPHEVITGDEFDAMTHEEKHNAALNYSVFARVSPEQKYNIIKLLQEENEVGFLGEGINDAPALKIANVAIVVQSGADIARDAADVILLKKSLEVIVEGIREGRKIFANISKYIKVTLSSNFGNFFAVATASLLIDFLPMLPIQILLLNLLSDFPMISIATDTVDQDELKRPKSYNIKEIVLLTTILGVVSTIFDFIFFGLFYRISPGVLQTNWFIGSVLTEIILIFSVRTKFFFLAAKRASTFLIGLAVLTVAITITLPLTSFGQKIFNFAKPQTNHLWLIFGIVICYFTVTEGVKLIYYRFTNHSQKIPA
ncbi:magnesium-translocating P-type ATPase [Candidatus Falkowbacteria bacterium]|nr:magnesium-translocating P-type ATPase [Candidatus Falkowbacteria bacterium]